MLVIPIVSIVGKSDSGKTTLIERLIPELIQRGYKVATVKHDVHGFEVDKEGKDSWRHRQAGAYCTIISSPKQMAVIRTTDHDATLEEIRDRFVDEIDIIISEGYKNDSAPKVEVFRKEVHEEPLCTREDSLVALVTNHQIDLGVPCLDLDDTEGLADLIEKQFLSAPITPQIRLQVNGRQVPLTSFTESFITRTVRGMIGTLKGCENPEHIELTINPSPQ
jgi:molybdopterin-guanine dinucleotide biosynthesis protein B